MRTPHGPHDGCPVLAATPRLPRGALTPGLAAGLPAQGVGASWLGLPPLPAPLALQVLPLQGLPRHPSSQEHLIY